MTLHFQPPGPLLEPLGLLLDLLGILFDPLRDLLDPLGFILDPLGPFVVLFLESFVRLGIFPCSLQRGQGRAARRDRRPLDMIGQCWDKVLK